MFETEGFVAKIYTAPPCPPDTPCKPSMKDNIVISENNKTLETYDLSDKELILFTDKTAELELGKKYNVKIKITDAKTTGEDLNDIELISSELLK